MGSTIYGPLMQEKSKLGCCNQPQLASFIIYSNAALPSDSFFLAPRFSGDFLSMQEVARALTMCWDHRVKVF